MSNIPEIILKDGHKIPMLGLGTSRLSDTYGAVKSALAHGYRHIDTAAGYGNEKEVGRAVKDSGVPREDIFITTKLDNNNHHRVEEVFNESLEKLDCGYIDLYLVHWPMPERVASWKTLLKMRQAGAPIRSLGVSNFTVRHMEELLKESEVTPVVNQIEFNPFVNQPDLLAYNQDKGIAVEAYSPMTRANKLDNPVVREVAEARGKSPAQIMLRWCVQQGIVVIPKAQSKEHQENNMDIFDWQLTGKDMERLGGLNEDFRVIDDPERFP